MVSGSVTGAGELLRLTQPTISKLIAQLERATDLKLFERSRGRLIPTPEAEALLHQVEKVFSAVEEVRRNTRQIARGRSGHLRIVAIPPLALRFLPGAIASFLKDNPDVRVTLNVRGTSYISEWIASEQADLGFVSGAPTLPGIVAEPFHTGCAICVLPTGHPLTAKRILRPEDLAREPLVTLSRETALRTLLDHTFATAGVERRSVVETGYSSAACALVAEGVGITIVDPISALDRYEAGRVDLRPFAPKVLFETKLLYAAPGNLSLVAQGFLQHVSQMRTEAAERLAQIIGLK
jgi:DNA-binding transcriptional LysR family regulator